MVEKIGNFIKCQTLLQTRDISEFEVKNMYDPVDAQTLSDMLAFTHKDEDILFFSYVYAWSVFKISEIVCMSQRTENCVTITLKDGPSYNVKGHLDDYLNIIASEIK
jgi:hypothetical protein